MEIKYSCPFWGWNGDKPAEFVDKVVDSGYNGIEIHLPDNKTFITGFLAKMESIINEKPGFFFILQQITNPQNDTVDEHIAKMEKNIWELSAHKPFFINSHTGKDYYSFDDNCRVIEATLNISSKTGVRIVHETHRGRFSFHAATLLPYLKKFPEMELVGDFSHFCCVSESMLHDQQAILDQIIPHVSHIHARIGFEQGPQVNDPNAPEWSSHWHSFIGWWDQMIADKIKKGWQQMTISPEFGPAPYMPAMPYTLVPLSNQWNNNASMMNRLRETL